MAKFCKQCGAQLEDAAKFCPGCGTTIEAQAPPPQQQYAPPPPQQQAPPPQQQYAGQAPPPQQQYAPPQQQYAPPQQHYAPPPQQQAPKKKIPKPLFVLIIIVAVIAGLVVVFNVSTSSTADKDYFDIGKDQVPSVKLVLGETRKVTGGGASTEIGVTTKSYSYQVAENQGAEMLKYAKALIEDYGYYNSTPNDFSGPTGKGFQFVKASVEEGYIVQVQIDYDEDGYYLTLSRFKGTLTIN